MNVERHFIQDGSRYALDTGACSYANGFAQIDQSQDAWYFGAWCNPQTLRIVTYTEGDLAIYDAETEEEFVTELRSMEQSSRENGWLLSNGKGLSIDVGLGSDLKARFEQLGITDLLW